MAGLLGLELNDAAALAAPLLIGENINPNNVAGLAHMVLQVLPLSVPIEIRQKNAAAPHRILVVLKILFVVDLIPDHFAVRVLPAIVVLPKQVYKLATW